MRLGQHRVRSLCLLTVAMGAASGCSERLGPESGHKTLEISDLPEYMRDFAADQTTPPIRTYERLVSESVDTFLFSMQWGEPQYCPSGCFYVGSFGLKVGDRIGWLTDGLYYTANPPRYFRFLPGDSSVLRPEFLDRIQRNEPRGYADLRFRACCDINTDEGLLFRIALQIHPFGHQRHARALLENPTAIRSVRILEVLAALPETDYLDQSTKARQLLNDLKNGIVPPAPDTVIGGACEWYGPIW